MSMNTRMGCFCAAGLVAAAGAGAQAGNNNLLIVDLTVVDQVTITADTGVSLASLTDTDSLGVYLENFYLGATGEGVFTSDNAGDLRVAGSTSDGSPGLFRSTDDPGLNFWSWTNDATSTFTAGQVAFEGSATWSLNSAEYADMLAGASGGDLYYPADTDDDLTSATLIGTYRVVPTPGTLAIAGVGGLMGVRRRRK